MAGGDNLLDGYIPVTYPTGILWNPYPSVLGTPALWPKGFPKTLKQGPGEDVLNQVMEMIPASSIGPLQFLPHAKHEDPLNPEYSAPPILALGLKTFAHLTEADTLFTSSSLWSLFLPKDPLLSSVYRGLLSQPLLWRLGLHTAFSRSSSYSKTIETAAEDVLHQDEVDVDLLHAILKTNLSACNTLPDCFQLLYSQHQKSEMSNIFKFYS